MIHLHFQLAVYLLTTTGTFGINPYFLSDAYILSSSFSEIKDVSMNSVNKHNSVNYTRWISSLLLHKNKRNKNSSKPWVSSISNDQDSHLNRIFESQCVIKTIFSSMSPIPVSTLSGTKYRAQELMSQPFRDSLEPEGVEKKGRQNGRKLSTPKI